MSAVAERVAAEERIATKRHRALEKARRVRERNAESAAEREVRDVQRRVGCTCDTKGKSHDELIAMCPGCPTGSGRGQWVCAGLLAALSRRRG